MVLTGTTATFAAVSGAGFNLTLTFSGAPVTVNGATFSGIATLLSNGVGGTDQPHRHHQHHGRPDLLQRRPSSPAPRCLTSSGNAAMGFGLTVNGAQSLTVNTAGATSFAAAVGGTTALASLTTNAGGGTSVAANVTTSAAQSYGDTLTLGGNVVLTGTTATFAAVSGAGFNLTLTFSGAPVTVNGATFSGIATLLSNGVGGTTNLTGTISTTAAQTYSNAAFLTGPTVLTSSGNAAIGFGLTVNGAQSLTVNTAGATSFAAAVGGTTALASLTTNAGGGTSVAANVTTSAAQSYGDTLTLGGNVVLTGTTATFAAVSGAGFNLTLTFSGAPVTVNGATFSGIATLLSNGVGGTTNLTGTISTTAAQTYSNAAFLTGPTVLTSSGNAAIGFGLTVNGAQSLTVNTAGATSFAAAVGGTTALASLTTNAGGTVSLAADVTTSGAGGQSYGEPVSLGGPVTLTSGGNPIVFAAAATVNGGEALVVDAAAGTVSFGAALGGVTPLDSLSVTASLIGLQSVATSTAGGQSYSGPVSLGGPVTLAAAAGPVSFSATVDGAQSLTVNTTGATSFAAAVGGTTALASLTTNAGGTVSLAADVTTSGAGGQSYGEPVSLGGPVTLTSGGNPIVFAAAATVNGGEALVVDAAAGTVSFGAALGGVTPLDSLSVTASLIGLQSVATSTAGGQSYSGPVSLGGPVTLAAAAGPVSFSATVDGAQSLTVNTTGATSFAAAVGGTTALASLTTNAGGGTSVAANVTTSAAQSYGDTLTLGGNVVLTGTTATFAAVSGAGFNLTLTFSGAPVTVNGATFSGIATLLSNGVGGTTNLTGTISTTAAQTYSNAAFLTGPTVLTSSGNAAIGFGLTVNGAQSLTVNTAGATSFAAAVGGTTALASLTTNAGGGTSVAANVTTSAAQSYGDTLTLGGNVVLTGTTATFAAVSGAGFNLTLTFSGAPVTVNGATFSGIATLLSNGVGGTTNLTGTISTTAAQTYSNAAFLTGPTVLTSSGNAAIGFGLTVNGAQSLTVNTAGATSFAAAVGGTTALASLTTNAGGTVSLAADVTTSGAGGQSYGEPVSLGGPVTLTSGGNPIVFAAAATVNGGEALVVDAAAGTVSFGAALGGVTPLDSLSVTASLIGLQSVATSTAGGQSYSGPVSLGGPVTLAAAAGPVSFSATVDGAQSLTVNTTGATSFAAAVGGTTALASLTTNAGGTVSLAADVTTSGAGGQSYGEPVSLGGPVTLTSGGNPIVFAAAATVNGGEALVVDAAAGTVSFGAALGGGTPLDSLSVTASLIGLQSVATSTAGGQSYSGPVSLGGPVTLAAAAGPVSFSATVDGAQSLTVNTTGATSFAAAVGGTTALASLTTNAGGGTSVAANVTTSAAQSYGDTLTLGGNVVLTGTTATFAAVSGAGFNLTLTFSGAPVTVNGATFSGIATLLSNGVGGTTNLTGTISTTAAQTYSNAAFLTGPTVLTSSGNAAIGFGLTVNGAQSLTVNTAGATSFAAAVGGTTALASLTTNAGGGTSVAANVTTSAAQSYGDTLTLGGNVVLTGTTATFAAVSGAGFNLTLTFSGAPVTVNGATFSGIATLLSNGVGGTTNLTGTISTTAAQTYSNAAFLTGPTVLTSSGNAAIGFGLTVNGAQSLTVNTTGATSFAAAVGGTTALASLTTNAGGGTSVAANVTTSAAQSYGDTLTLGGNVVLTGTTATFAAVSGAGFNLTLTFSGAPVTVNGATFSGIATLLSNGVGGTTNLTGTISTTAAQTYSNAAFLTGPTVLTSSGNAAIGFGLTVNGAQSLTVNTTGATSFAAAVGGTTALASLTTNAGGTVSLAADVTTSGAGGQSYGEPVSLGGPVTLTSGGNPIVFAAAATVNGGEALVVDAAAGTVSFGAALGGVTPLDSLSVTASLIGLQSVATSTAGGQSYSGPVSLGGPVTLAAAAGPVSFSATVDGAQSLTVNTTGATSFAAAVGGTTALASLTTNAGGGTSVAANVTTSAAQSYGDTLTLGGNVVLTGTTATFAAVSGAGFNLTLTFSGAPVTVNGATFSGIATLLSNGVGGTTNLTGTISTTAAQTYSNAAFLTGPTVLTSSGNAAIGFGLTVNGAQSLTVNTAGATSFAAAVGGTTALASLTTQSTGSVIINADVRTSTGNISFGDAQITGDCDLTPGGGTANFTQNLSITAGSTALLAGNMTITGNLTIAGGSVFTDTSNGSITIGGGWTNGGTFNAQAGTTVLSGTCALTSGGSPFYNLTISSSGDVTPQDALEVGRNLNIQVGGVYTHNGQTLTLGGPLATAGTITDSNGGTQNLGNVTIDTADKTIQSDIQMNSLSVSSSLNVNGHTLTVSGAFDNTGILYRLGQTAPGTGEKAPRDNDTGTVVYQGVGGTFIETYAGSPAVRDYNSLRIDGPGSFLLGSNIGITNNLLLNGGTLQAGTRQIYMEREFDSTGGGVFAYGTSEVIFENFSKDSYVRGNNTFYRLTCTTDNKTIIFQANATQTIAGGGRIRIRASGTGVEITLKSTQPNPPIAAPPAFPPMNALQWGLDVPLSATLDIDYVYVELGFSVRPIVPNNLVDAFERFGWPDWNHNWRKIVPVIGSWTEDFPTMDYPTPAPVVGEPAGNGKIDRIRVQVLGSISVNDDFSGFSAEVTGYTVVGYSTGTGPGSINDDTFYILLQEKDYLDTEAAPTWTIAGNTTLVAILSPNKYVFSLAPPETATDDAPPVIAYTMAVVDKSPVRFSCASRSRWKKAAEA